MKNKSNFFSKFPWTRITIGCVFLVILGYSLITYFQEKNSLPQVCSGDVCFSVEIARTKAEQHQGLMNRDVMPENHGMIFIFPKLDLYNFWMKNTRIPLDIVRMDDQGKVVRILQALPCTGDPCPLYKPEIFAKYVLEINAGIAAKYGISEGNILKIKNIK